MSNNNISPAKILEKINAYADNLEFFTKDGTLTHNTINWDFKIFSMIGQVSFSKSMWGDLTSSGFKTHILSIGSVKSRHGLKLYNCTFLWFCLILSFLSKDSK